MIPFRRSQVSFTEMRDSLDPTTAEARVATLLKNVYPIDTHQGAAVVGRPGCQQMGSQLGAAGTRRMQRVYQFTKLDGTEYTVGFCGGLMYTFDWVARSWSSVALSGVSLSTSGVVYCATFADKLVVSDGTNIPWTWDGSSFVTLSNCPVLYGPPTVYYAKLFGVKNSDRNVIVWSEEADPTTGYEANDYNNAWRLGQTDQEALECLVGTNEALYYWRSRSLNAISGAVTPEFVSSGTREGVSETIGTESPNSVTVFEGDIYFLSADGHPYRLPVGGRPIPAWEGLRETLAAIPRSLITKAVGAAYQPTQHVLLGFCAELQSEVGTLAAFDTRTQKLAGLWDGFNAVTLDVVKNQDGVPTLIHGSENGYAYDHGHPNGSLWTDALNATDGGTTAIEHDVIGTPLAYETHIESAFVRLDMTCRAVTDMTLSVSYETPRGTNTAQSVSVTANTASWDGTWDGTWAGVIRERHAAVGWKGYGRWIKPRVLHQSGVQRFGLIAWTVTGAAATDHPSAK